MGRFSSNEEFREWFKKYLPYMVTFFSFMIGVYILLIIMDQFVLPALVHDKDKVKVPNLQGRTLQEAIDLLRRYDLEYQVSGEQYSATQDKNSIIKQAPAPNTLVKKGRPIYLTISKGKELVYPPYLIGKNIRQARIELMQKGLILGEITYGFSNDVPRDLIMSQSVNSSSQMPYGDALNIVISQGAQSAKVAPELTGKTLDEVDGILSRMGIQRGTVTYVKNGTFLPNTVVEQDPPAGTPLDSASSVNIILAR